MNQGPPETSHKQRWGLSTYQGYFSGTHKANGQPELTSKPAEEKAFKGVIKRNGVLEAELVKLEKQKAKVDEANERLQRDNEALKTQATVLKDGIAQLKGVLEESERIREAQMEELRQLQAQDYERSKGATGELHEAISSQFRKIFAQCSRWARDYFNIKMVDFDISKFPEFKRELEEVSWSNSDWGSKVLFNASHLVQAVLGNMICDQIFSSPFSGTPQGFRQEFQDMYEIKYSIDRAEAQRWRASSFQTLYSSKRWPLNSNESHSLRTYKQHHANDIYWYIDEVLRPIITAYYPNLSDQEADVQKERLLSIVEDAKALGEKISKQSSELRMLSKSWFSENNRLFTLDDVRMESRLGNDEYDPQDDLRVDLILFPGFLKYGNDNAENLDDWNVWTPAIVEIDGLLPPLPPRRPAPPAKTRPAFTTGYPELPGDGHEPEAASPSTTTEQEHYKDGEYEDVLIDAPMDPCPYDYLGWH
ncbi:hypothetical protein HOY82DRAFT_673416 [Tuber indicum]|nr:hypothetical protein HOY82DRAFT_673416 [Tuber indicum]